MPSPASNRTTAWTGGQYSLYRAVFGIGLAALALAGEAPMWGRSLAAMLALALAVGLADRLAAAALWFLIAWHTGMRGLEGVPTAMLWLLLLHLGAPARPYGAWAMRGRVDPGGGWRLPWIVATLAWLGLAVAHAAAASTMPWDSTTARIVGALRLLFALLLLVPRTRRLAWLALLGLAFAPPLLAATPAAATAWLLLHLAAFDPAWLPPRRAAAPLLVCYDGHCGLCHRFVRFGLAEDPTGDLLRFAPLQGDTFAATVPAATRTGLPDSVVVHDGTRLAVRSSAALAVLFALGGLWRVVGSGLWLVPRPLRDRGYDAIARVRKRLFAAPADACPILPPALRTRFSP